MIYSTTLWDRLRNAERPSEDAMTTAVEVLDDWLVDSLNKLTTDDGDGNVSLFRLRSVTPRFSAEGVGLVREAFGMSMAEALREIKHYADTCLALDNDVLKTQWRHCPAHGMELTIVRK